ncbi:MAG: hypothetical protein ACYDGM_00295 [Vulcanimicrobiaceae bacterium]
MRRFPTAVAIFVFALVMVIIGWYIYIPGEYARLQRVAATKKAPSEIYTHLLIRYDKPPIYEEEYSMQDVEGISSFQYRIRGYNGKQITISAPPSETYDVSFFYGKINLDGIWQLVNQPPRGNTSIHYTLYVKQAIDFKQGDRTITFTDPKYWATTAGRQYSIDLSKQQPTDLLKLKSTALADPHYRMVVDDFRNFGPASFRAKIAAARASFKRGK